MHWGIHYRPLGTSSTGNGRTPQLLLARGFSSSFPHPSPEFVNSAQNLLNLRSTYLSSGVDHAIASIASINNSTPGLPPQSWLPGPQIRPVVADPAGRRQGRRD